MLQDIIILVALGVFIYYSFFSFKIPKDDDKNRKNKPKNPGMPPYGAPPATPSAAQVQIPQKPIKPRRPTTKELEGLEGLDRVRAFDPQFDEKHFLTGAREAYRMFHTAVAEHDEKTLEAMTAPRLLDKILDEMDVLKAAGQTRRTQIDSIDNVSVTASRINGRTVVIEVKYTATQAQQVVKKGGAITVKPEQVESVWTWARNADAADPNWDLEAINPVA